MIPFMIDVSDQGMCLVPHEPLPACVGGYLAVVVTLDENDRIEIDARVRHLGDGRIGLQFFALDAPRRDAVARLIEAARAE